MAKISKNEMLAAILMPEIVRQFAGREIGNAALKNWLCATFPSHFPTNRADGFVEYVASVDFASCAGGKGYGTIKGILRDKHGNIMPENTKGASRSWVIPHAPEMRTKAEAYEVGELGAAAKTKLRRAPTFGEYVAAKKDKND